MKYFNFIKQYKKNQLKEYFEDESQKELFQQFLKSELPSAFRLNPAQNNIDIIENKIQQEYKEALKVYDTLQDPELPKIAMKKVEWFPGKMAYKLNLNKNKIKKTKYLKKFHKLIQKSSDCGFIQRQELVSMLPPLFLDIQEDDLVLDMCAAPGSKTSQLIEFVRSKQKQMSTGAIVANEIDFKRAWILSHQVKRLNFPGIAIINHAGQSIPGIKKDNKKMLYDKILVDVPCSGDGAIRKLPDKWKNWNPLDGNALNTLQISILERAVNLVKVNGLIAYSTCSLNAVENEAVVAHTIKSFKDKGIELELVDLHTYFPELIKRKGLKKWIVQIYNKDYTGENGCQGEFFQKFSNYSEYENIEEKDNKISRKMHESLFPLDEKFMEEINIQRTVRIMPNDNDTGGFFVALLKKVSGVQKSQNMKQSQQTMVKNQKIKELYEKISDNDLQLLKERYELKNDFPLDQLVRTTKSNKRIFILSKKLSEIIDLDKLQKYDKIYMGTAVFVKCKGIDNKKDSDWRLAQDGIQVLYPYMKPKYIISLSSKFLKFLIQEKSISLGNEETEYEDELKKWRQLQFGGYCGKFQLENMKQPEILAMQRMSQSVVLLVSREDTEGLKIKYFPEMLNELKK